MKTAAVVAVLLAAVPAAAQPTVEVVPTCVVADDAQRIVLVRALERMELLIVETGCQETITLTEEIEGEKIVLRLWSTTAKRKMKVKPTDDRAAAYTKMAKSLLEPEPEPTPPPAPAAIAPFEEYPSETPAITTQPLVQVDEPATDEVPMRSALYAMLGLAAHGDGAGTSATFGYRTGTRTKLDLGAQIVDTNGGGTNATTAAWRVQLLRHWAPNAASSFYLGGGLAYASSNLGMDTGTHSTGSGLRLEGTLGVEFARTARKSFYLESTVGLPVYFAGERYPATLAVSIGAGM